MIRSQRLHSASILMTLTLMLLIVALISISLGSTRLSLSQLAASLVGHGRWIDNLIIFQMRLPRLVLSILIGSGLAVSGVTLQGITRNDLASPDTVGVNAGSGLGMMFLLVMYPTAATQMPWLMPVGAIVGALMITAIVFALAYRQGSVLPSRLLLVGIAMGFGAHAAMLLFSLRMSFVMYSYVVTWMSGTLASGDWNSVFLLAPCCLILISTAFSRARVLNVFSLGDGVSASLGIAVERERLLLLIVATMLTSACVAIGGLISFLGLAAPHLARRIIGQNHSVLFPTAALCGAILLLLADTLGRYVFAPIEMPAGVFVGILGGAYFLYLLATTRG